jgi:hypothetical protein
VPNEQNPTGVGTGGASGAPIVNTAPVRLGDPNDPNDQGQAGTGAGSRIAPRTSVPVDPGVQQAEAPIEDVAGLQGGQVAEQSTDGGRAVQGSQDDGGQMNQALAQTGGDVDRARNLAAQAPQAQTLTDGSGRAQNLPDQQAAGQAVGQGGVPGESGGIAQPQPQSGQGVGTAPAPNTGAATPGTMQGGMAPLLRILAAKMLVDNGGQMPDLVAMEGSVQQVLSHVQAHAGRMGLVGTGARPQDQTQAMPQLLAALLAYGLVATVGTAPNLDQHQQGVEQLLGWAHDLR